MIDVSEIEWERTEDWYDGPLSGVVVHQGKRLYAVWTDSPNDRDRTYTLYDLPAEQWAKEDARHALFMEKVGDAFNGGTKPKEIWHEYYDVYPPRAEDFDYSRFPAYGQFTN